MPHSALLTTIRTRRYQLVSLPVSELGNMSAIPSVIVDNIASACGFGANEQARDLQYDSSSSMVYISTQQYVDTIIKPSQNRTLILILRPPSHRYDDSRPFDLGHAAYALGPLAGAREEAPLCQRLTYFTGDYDMVAQVSVAIGQF